MPGQSHQSLEVLAEEDPVSRPLATLQLEALRAASAPAWREAAAALSDVQVNSPAPALHGLRLEVNPREVTRLVRSLADTLARSGGIEPGRVPREIPDSAAWELLLATLQWDSDALARIADDTGAAPSVVATLGHCTALPLLLACGERLNEVESRLDWQPGYCPVCGSWPLLAEQRGLNRQQWLRCNRCSTAWRSRHQRCVYCDNTDHETLGYMAPEAERESRRAVTCENCKGYLKVFATVSPLEPADILRLDLQSLELDIAAMDDGYARPERPGFAPEVELVPAETQIRRWLPWN